MELAGQSVADCIFHLYENDPLLKEKLRDVIFFCGPGNNGGDGIVAARHLRNYGFMTTILVENKEAKNEFFKNLLKTTESNNVNILEFKELE